MRLFSRHLKASRPAEVITLPHIEFIGEQAGPVEDDLKAQLRQVLQKTPAVQSAYLAWLSYGDSPVNSVGLCIRSTAGVDHPLRSGSVSARFSQIGLVAISTSTSCSLGESRRG